MKSSDPEVKDICLNVVVSILSDRPLWSVNQSPVCSSEQLEEIVIVE